MTDPWLQVSRHLRRDRVCDLLREAVSVYSPSYAEMPVVDLFDEALDRCGLSHRRQPVDPGDSDGRCNLIIEMGPEPFGIAWIGHLDTIALLTDEELDAREEGDVLYGLGTADMKAGCAAVVEALAAIKSSAVALRRGVAVALVVGEEEYGDGTQALPASLIAPVTVVGEPTGLVPCLSHHAHVELELRAEGERAHAALPEVGANAIHAMLDWLSTLWASLPSLVGTDAVALNLREIRGGESRFVVADRCDARLDVHMSPDRDASRFEGLVEAARQGVQPRHPNVRLAWDRAFAGQGYVHDPSHERFNGLRQAYSLVGLPFEPAAFRSHSDAGWLLSKGHQPVICGPGRLEVAHTVAEHVSLEETWQAARLYAAMMLTCCA